MDSQQLGREDCVENVTIPRMGHIVHVPPGTVCIECVFEGVVAADATFQIDNSNIDASIGRVVDGVLVVFNTESVFNSSSSSDVHCSSTGLNAGHTVLLFLESKSYYTESHCECLCLLNYSFQDSINHWSDHPP